MDRNYLALSCLVLCLGAVLAARDRFLLPDRELPELRPDFPFPEPIDPFFPGPVDPGLRPLPPSSNKCHGRSGGWQWDMLEFDHYPQADRNTFYYGCKVWRPRWTSCQGNCFSNDNMTAIQPPAGFRQNCQYCRAVAKAVVTPKPYCLVITVANSRPSWGYRYVDTRISQYSYYAYTACSCLRCSRSKVEPRTTEVDEDRVIGRPAPPKASRDEEMRVFGSAVEKNRSLRPDF